MEVAEGEEGVWEVAGGGFPGGASGVPSLMEGRSPSTLGVRCKYLLGEHSAPPLHPTSTRHLNILKEQNENSLGGF